MHDTNLEFAGVTVYNHEPQKVAHRTFRVPLIKHQA
jgi:hypothetical protein